jgi:hypothetical protein
MIAISRLFYEHWRMRGRRSSSPCAGFGDLARCAAGEGRQQPNGDTSERGDGTLYVEGVKTLSRGRTPLRGPRSRAAQIGSRLEASARSSSMRTAPSSKARAG